MAKWLLGLRIVPIDDDVSDESRVVTDAVACDTLLNYDSFNHSRTRTASQKRGGKKKCSELLDRLLASSQC